MKPPSNAIRRDERVFLMGADVDHYGGCFAVSKGMPSKNSGPERIIGTPLGVGLHRRRASAQP
ncbi:MAG: hypothetical protein R2838_19920 [Caldilineaceae bacterium]